MLLWLQQIVLVLMCRASRGSQALSSPKAKACSGIKTAFVATVAI